MNKPLHNIVVLDNPSVTAELIEAFKPTDSHTGAYQDMRSREAIADALSGRDLRARTSDNLQFFQFKHQYAPTNAGHFTGREHANQWLKILTDACKRTGQKIDVIVIPEPTAESPLGMKGTLANSYRKLFAELREAWPSIRIIALRPTVDSGYCTPVTFETVYSDNPEKTPMHSHVNALEAADGVELFAGDNRSFAAHLRQTLAHPPARRTGRQL